MIATFALILLVGLLVTAFGWRTYAHRKATGDTGWRGISGHRGSVEWLAGVGFVVGLIVGAIAPVAELLGLEPTYDVRSVRYLGLVIAGAGIALTLRAQTAMHDSWRIGVDQAETTTLRTNGIFALVRNPIFSAMTISAIGLSVAVPNIFSLIGTGMLISAIHAQVRRVEEPYLRRTHGTAYKRYEQSVGRFIPRIRPSTEVETRGDEPPLPCHES